MSRRTLPKRPCPNCGQPVKYGSQHCRGNDELHARWICEKPRDTQETARTGEENTHV